MWKTQLQPCFAGPNQKNNFWITCFVLHPRPQPLITYHTGRQEELAILWTTLLFLPETPGTCTPRKKQKCFTGIRKVIHRHKSHGLWENSSPTGDHPPAVEQKGIRDYSKKMTENYEINLFYFR